MTQFAESTIEQAALAWLESVGWSARDRLEVAPDMPDAERSDYGHASLPQRLRDPLLPKHISGELRVTAGGSRQYD